MNCACVYVDTGDWSRRLSEKRRRAVKPHRCQECGREISPMEIYEYVVGIYDGFFTHKTCLDCLSVRDTFFCDGYEYGAMWEYLGEHIRDLDGEISEDCLTALTPAARGQVCEIIETVWENDEDAWGEVEP